MAMGILYFTADKNIHLFYRFAKGYKLLGFRLLWFWPLVFTADGAENAETHYLAKDTRGPTQTQTYIS